MQTSKPGDFVAVTDQASKRIVVLDLDVKNWGAGKGVVWSWSPMTSRGWEGLEVNWGFPTDAKLRTNEVFGGQSMVITDSSGLAAIVPYAQGGCKQWGRNVGGNPHSAELLPNGNIAIAASTGGWVRVYTSSQGPDSGSYAEYALPGAHGVQWDPLLQILWALGDDALVALKICGEDRSPELREAKRIPLPTRYGHDLQPVYGNTDRLWISTGTKVYQYVKSADVFDESYPGSGSISRARVKSIGNTASGRVISTVPDGIVRPATGYEDNDWCTDTIDLFDPNEQRVLPGSAVYKARVWNTEYL